MSDGVFDQRGQNDASGAALARWKCTKCHQLKPAAELEAVTDGGLTCYPPCSEARLARETVDHPAHYGGAGNPYEAIKVIEAWDLDFCLGNTVKYISRAGKKDPAKTLEDLRKAAWYLNRRIEQLARK